MVRRIVDAIAPRPHDFILEIGPGEGVLTRPLLDSGATLEAVEIDRDLAARLVEAQGAALRVHCLDALAFDFGALPRGARIVGNLPYGISTPLLFHLARWADRFADLHVMLQREVVERMVARPCTPAYGRLSVMLQLRFRMQLLFRVAGGAFRPPPAVESALARLVPLAGGERPAVDAARIAEVVTRAFSARRKTLRNALGLDESALRALGLEPKLRPENLAPADYVRIAEYLGPRASARSADDAG